MQKIPTLFMRGQDHLVTPSVNQECEWVMCGEGLATRKHDGSCCLIKDGRLWKRHEARYSREVRSGDWFPPSQLPQGFIAVTDIDVHTGKRQGWVPVGEGKGDQWHREAFEAEAASRSGLLVEGVTYELCGPKVQGNPEGFATHVLVPHGFVQLPACPRDFQGIKEFLIKMNVEGVVWHHPDGRMCKIKIRDYGLSRKPPQ